MAGRALKAEIAEIMEEVYRRGYNVACRENGADADYESVEFYVEGFHPDAERLMRLLGEPVAWVAHYSCGATMLTDNFGRDIASGAGAMCRACYPKCGGEYERHVALYALGGDDAARAALERIGGLTCICHCFTRMNLPWSYENRKPHVEDCPVRIAQETLGHE